jgi:hypothetical protein
MISKANIGDVSVILCGDFGAHCSDCGAVSDNLCDYPVGKGKTCDRKICDDHSKRVGLDIHYCPTHAKHWNKFRRSGGVEMEMKNIVPFEE